MRQVSREEFVLAHDAAVASGKNYQCEASLTEPVRDGYVHRRVVGRTLVSDGNETIFWYDPSWREDE